MDRANGVEIGTEKRMDTKWLSIFKDSHIFYKSRSRRRAAKSADSGSKYYLLEILQRDSSTLRFNLDHLNIDDISNVKMPA